MISYKKIFLVFVVVVFSIFIFSLQSFLKSEKKQYDRLYPHVYIDSLNFGNRTKNDVTAHFDKLNQSLNKLHFTLLLDNNKVASLAASDINLHYDSEGLALRAYLIGRSSNTLSRFWQKIATVYFDQPFQIESNIDYDKESVRQTVANLQSSFNKPAKNALFKFENGRVVSFAPQEPGLELNADQVLTDFSKTIFLLRTKPENKTIVIKKKILEPEITLDKANHFGIEELIGEGKSDFTGSIQNRIHNVILATSKFNGVLIPKGATFSFNDTVGDISPTTGYLQAYIIKGGKTVLGDGGGVCQVSTTLFRAALNTGLPIVKRFAHAYRVGYYENDAKPGFDATVFAPSVDLKIKNDTPAYILIQTQVDENNNLLYFRLYGKKDGRRVELTTPTLWDVQPPPPPVNQDDPTLKKGVTKQVDFAAYGSKASFNYKVTYPDGTINEKTFFSNFQPWRAVFLVGTAN